MKDEGKISDLTERPKLHDFPQKRFFGIGDVKKLPLRCTVYSTDRECIEAGDICASPALFEN